MKERTTKIMSSADFKLTTKLLRTKPGRGYPQINGGSGRPLAGVMRLHGGWVHAGLMGSAPSHA